MEKELNHRLFEFINEGKSILKEIPTKKQIRAEMQHYRMSGKYTPGAALINDMAHDVVGDALQDAAKEFLGLPKKYTKGLKSYTRRQQKSQAAKERERLKQGMDSEYQRRLSFSNNQYLAWDKKLKDFLSNVSIVDDGKVIATSKQLLQKVLRAGKYTRLETRIRHIATLLEEYSVYTVVHNETVKDYSIERISGKIRLLEEDLRDFISTNLKEIHGPDWWVKTIPPDVRENAEKRREKAAKLNPEDMNIPPIQFTDFSDLSKILSRKDNRKIFGNMLKPIDAFIIKLRELEPIRNTLFHARKVSKKDIDKVDLYVKEFEDKIKTKS